LRARAPWAQDGKPFAAEQIGKGSALYETHCQTCHGTAPRQPGVGQGPAQISREDHARFVDTVTYGVRNMPPWGDLLKPDDVEALWAYVRRWGNEEVIDSRSQFLPPRPRTPQRVDLIGLEQLAPGRHGVLTFDTEVRKRSR